MTTIRTGQAPDTLSREAFGARFRASFIDPAYRAEDAAIVRMEAIAWEAYNEGRKAPFTQKAGAGYTDPAYDLSTEWVATKARIDAAQARWALADTPTRALLVCGSARNDGTCPGEMSKSFRTHADRARSAGGRRRRVRCARPEPAHVRVPAPHPPLQGLRVHRHAAVPLALQLLPQPRAGPDARLDGRDLRALDRRARGADRHPGLLVPERRARSS